MPVAAIYDIHANLPALEAVIEDIRRTRVDLIIVGGDVLPGPMPCECLDYLVDLDMPARFIRGNGETAVLDEMAGVPQVKLPEHAREAIGWTVRQLRERHRRVIEGWPATVSVGVHGLGDVLFCHATPRSDTEIFTRETSEDRLVPLFDRLGVPLVVCGHTHMQFDRMVGSVRVVNAGSVGMPFGGPAACWLLLGPGIELRRTPYDVAAAGARIRQTAYPQAGEFVEHSLLGPPSEDEMLEAFRRAELR